MPLDHCAKLTKTYCTLSSNEHVPSNACAVLEECGHSIFCLSKFLKLLVPLYLYVVGKPVPHSCAIYANEEARISQIPTKFFQPFARSGVKKGTPGGPERPTTKATSDCNFVKRWEVPRDRAKKVTNIPGENLSKQTREF